MSVNLRNARGWKMHTRELYPALGLRPEKHLPDAGVSWAKVGNVICWVIPKEEALLNAKLQKRAFVHRVWCVCPDCGWSLPASRLHQHQGSRRCSSTKT